MTWFMITMILSYSEGLISRFSQPNDVIVIIIIAISPCLLHSNVPLIIICVNSFLPLCLINLVVVLLTRNLGFHSTLHLNLLFLCSSMNQFHLFSWDLVSITIIIIVITVFVTVIIIISVHFLCVILRLLTFLGLKD
jgi:hypothetical protein